MGKILTYVTAFGFVVACIISACNTSGCVENQSSIPRAGFYSMDTQASLTLDSIDIGGVGAPNDTLMVSMGTRASQVYLPFRSAESSSTFFIHYGYKVLDSDEMNDTLWFQYESTPYFASEECGAMYRYNITSMRHTSHLIDSVAIIDSLITNVDIERILIYFRSVETEIEGGE